MTVEPWDSRDLETIVTLLELAAITLTTKPKAVFTREALIQEAHRYAGPKIRLDERDIGIVLPHMQHILRKVKNGYQMV